jgi:hypothetical protein
MKIICVDNFDREHVSDELVCENVNSYYAKTIVATLNAREHKNSANYYKAVPDDHILYVYDPS